MHIYWNIFYFFCMKSQTNVSKRQMRIREKEHKNAIDKPSIKSAIGGHCREYDHQIGYFTIKREL